ncbi:MAG: hypothetical protein R3B90_09810 [Planctomycetaceae bacterium]
MSQFEQQRQLLLSQLVRGEIDQGTYERMLAELQGRARPVGASGRPEAGSSQSARRSAASAAAADR